MPSFETGSVEANVDAGVPVGVVFFHPVGLPATTSERPRGATRYGTASGWSSDESLTSGVATMSPRTVRTPPRPSEKVSSLGRAANADAGIDRLALTVIVWPAGIVTSAGDTVMDAPR